MSEWEQQFVAGYRRGIDGVKLPAAPGMHEAFVRGNAAGYAVCCWLAARLWNQAVTEVMA